MSRRRRLHAVVFDATQDRSEQEIIQLAKQRARLVGKPIGIESIERHRIGVAPQPTREVIIVWLELRVAVSENEVSGVSAWMPLLRSPGKKRA